MPTISEIYRRGWLARALAVSVRELLLLIRCTGLNPFAPLPDLAATAPVQPPPLILFTRLTQALASAGLQPSQALYLLWNWDLSGTTAPAESVITGLAGALRQAFAAVNSQFTVKDDPSGTFAKSLMTQVTGTAAADYFFGLLTGAVVTSVSYTAPAGALPQAVATARQRPAVVRRLRQAARLRGIPRPWHRGQPDHGGGDRRHPGCGDQQPGHGERRGDHAVLRHLQRP